MIYSTTISIFYDIKSSSGTSQKFRIIFTILLLNILSVKHNKILFKQFKIVSVFYVNTEDCVELPELTQTKLKCQVEV